MFEQVGPQKNIDRKKTLFRCSTNISITTLLAVEKVSPLSLRSVMRKYKNTKRNKMILLFHDLQLKKIDFTKF